MIFWKGIRWFGLKINRVMMVGMWSDPLRITDMYIRVIFLQSSAALASLRLFLVWLSFLSFVVPWGGKRLSPTTSLFGLLCASKTELVPPSDKSLHFYQSIRHMPEDTTLDILDFSSQTRCQFLYSELKRKWDLFRRDLEIRSVSSSELPHVSDW
jgi:hypothetical protein